MGAALTEARQFGLGGSQIYSRLCQDCEANLVIFINPSGMQGQPTYYSKQAESGRYDFLGNELMWVRLSFQT